MSTVRAPPLYANLNLYTGSRLLVENLICEAFINSAGGLEGLGLVITPTVFDGVTP